MKKRLDCILEKLRLAPSRLRQLWADKGFRKKIISISSVALVVALAVVCAAIYLGDYYRADSTEIGAFAPMKSVAVDTSRDGVAVALAENAEVGLIFYPGGKVEYTAYLPLMAACAERGILAAVVEMPFNLAVLDMNAADGIRELYPEIERWYIGGHSLGGSMAASYVAKNSEDFSGLVLLGSYSTADISLLGISVLSLYGSADGIMNRENYEKYSSNLPAGFDEIVIDGANHAGFGMYGDQDGDGAASISHAEQIIVAADYIAKFIFDGE